MTQIQLAQRPPIQWGNAVLERPARRTAADAATASARRGTESMDRAFYRCGCGYVFTAAVTTTVGCPHCGTSQAW